jgi:Raf kinase inhibitor-like YbhB/YbcL family protein
MNCGNDLLAIYRAEPKPRTRLERKRSAAIRCSFVDRFYWCSKVTSMCSVKSGLKALALVAGMLTGGAAMALTLTSSAFSHNGSIPTQYTCEGSDISPDLSWGEVPPETKSLVLILDDPDAPDPAAPRLTWVHWVLYNIPANATGLPQAVAAKALPAGTKEGLNDWKRTGYGGPCPPIGRHRYFHKLYALDVVLPDLGRATKVDIEKAMKGHVLAEAQLIGTYQKKK